jgi:hypothetical protein
VLTCPPSAVLTKLMPSPRCVGGMHLHVEVLIMDNFSTQFTRVGL